MDDIYPGRLNYTYVVHASHFFVWKWHINNLSPKKNLFLHTILLHTSYVLLFYLNINQEHYYIYFF